MNFETAKTLLSECDRHELRDHAFGDVEVMWMKDGQKVAEGYFSHTRADVVINGVSFEGADAIDLSKCGTIGNIERNDETGPDEFVLGQTMPGLTREGVNKELQRRNVFEDLKPNPENI